MNLSPLQLVQNIEAGFGCSCAHGERPGCCLAFERAGDVRNDGLALVIEDLACAELLHELEILWRRGGDDFVACCDSELDCIAANARRSTPNEKCFTPGFRMGYGRQ